MDDGKRDTRAELLDAALEIVAARGLQALTHRGVEARAGVSHGVTTYHFRTRAAMIEALLTHISQRLVEWTADGYRQVLASDPETFDREAFSQERMTEATTTFRTLMLAKFELYLDAARHPERQRALRALRADHIEQQAEVFRVLGARDPELAANRLLSALEGAMIYQLSAPEDGYERWVGSYITAVMDALVDFTAPPASPERATR